MNESNSTRPETFESFYKSFFYGTRSDMSFKFLAELSETDASDFFRELLQEAVNGLDAGEPDRIDRLLLKWQTTAYDKPGKFTYESAPFSRMEKPASQTTIGLISSSGHFVKGKDPQPLGTGHLSQEEAEQRIMEFIKLKPELSEIPIETAVEDLEVRHGGYDTRAARIDPNTVFPYQRLKEMATAGKVGKLAAAAYSFVGACSQLKLQKESLPGWVERFKSQALDGLILIPV